MDPEEFPKAYPDDQIDGVAVAELFIGYCSTSGANQSLSGIRSLALHLCAKVDRRLLAEQLFYIQPLAGQECPVEVAGLQAHQAEEWAAICKGQPPIEVLEQIDQFVKMVTAKGWTIQLYLDSQEAGHEFYNFFSSVGVSYLARNSEFQRGFLTPSQILEQVCCNADLSAPDLQIIYRFRSYIDMEQQMAAVAGMIGCKFDYWKLAEKVLKRPIGSRADDLARDHAQVWYAFRDKADDHARAITAYDRPVTEVWANCESYGLHLYNSKLRLAEFFA